MTETLLEVEALETGYTRPVIGPISFQLDSGQVAALVGPNGAGKSTLLKAIADNAHVFGGRVVRRTGLTIAWMEQQQLRLDEMPFSGWEYLRFTGADHYAPPERLAGWLDKRIDSLSGGQFQLLSCWTALGSAAQLILLDEPTNNLDEESARVLRDVLTRNRAEQRDRSVLVVSHDPMFLDGVCDWTLQVHA